MKTYTSFFARDGYISMWARSICYRTWISGGFPLSFMLKNKSPLDAGWSRRLCTGSLLQFVTREEFYVNDIPSLGFYGHREFVLQNYSCPGSPLLMFLPFIALAHRGRNIESDESTVLYARKKRLSQNPAMELMITVMLHKTDDNEWTKEELSPLREINILEITTSGSALGAEIFLSDGSRRIIDFKDIDGYKSC